MNGLCIMSYGIYLPFDTIISFARTPGNVSASLANFPINPGMLGFLVTKRYKKLVSSIGVLTLNAANIQYSIVDKLLNKVLPFLPCFQNFIPYRFCTNCNMNQ